MAQVIRRQEKAEPPPPQPFYSPFFWDYPGEPVPEEKLLDFMVQGQTNRGRDTPTIRLGATPSGLSSADLHQKITVKHATFTMCRNVTDHPVHSDHVPDFCVHDHHGLLYADHNRLWLKVYIVTDVPTSTHSSSDWLVYLYLNTHSVMLKKCATQQPYVSGK